MRVEDLDLRELLDFEANGGVLHFGENRAVIFDTVAFGQLRTALVNGLGEAAARGVFTRFGYVHGRRTAESVQKDFPWDTGEDWRRAGPRLQMLSGMVEIEQFDLEHSDDGTARVVWNDSYEAEQHLLHQGKSHTLACWTLTGFLSGYLSATSGQEVYCIETSCVAKGDEKCRAEARPKDAWGPVLERHLPFYEREFLDASLQEMTERLKRTERRLRTRRIELRKTRSELATRILIAQSKEMKTVLEFADRVADVDSTVLILGPSGVGKERIAERIHAESRRAKGPFLAVNCGAIPESLIESELFGHVKGAFSGAVRDRPGLFEAASSGTLFLDEVGELPASMQVKLLRAVQQREIRRVGEDRVRRVDVRILAATNRDLRGEVDAKRFREDLYYRLRVVELKIPALSSRTDDILPLARAVLARLAPEMAPNITGFAPGAADALLRYSWPGNIRELENAVEHALIVSRGPRIDEHDLPEELRATGQVVVAAGSSTLADVEREFILATLDAKGGNRQATAEQLGIGLATLYRRLKEYRSGGA